MLTRPRLSHVLWGHSLLRSHPVLDTTKWKRSKAEKKKKKKQKDDKKSKETNSSKLAAVLRVICSLIAVHLLPAVAAARPSRTTVGTPSRRLSVTLSPTRCPCPIAIAAVATAAAAAVAAAASHPFPSPWPPHRCRCSLFLFMFLLRVRPIGRRRSCSPLTLTSAALQ